MHLARMQQLHATGWLISEGSEGEDAYQFERPILSVDIRAAWVVARAGIGCRSPGCCGVLHRPRIGSRNVASGCSRQRHVH